MSEDNEYKRMYTGYLLPVVKMKDCTATIDQFLISPIKMTLANIIVLVLAKDNTAKRRFLLILVKNISNHLMLIQKQYKKLNSF